METGRRGILLVPTTIGICAAILVFSGGECVPSPQHNHRYDYDIGMDLENQPPSAHSRVRRSTGRGTALDTWSCGTITTVPDEIRTDFPLDTFYQKYTHAYGIPIVSSNKTQDAALTRACYTVRFLLADRKDIRDAMYDQYGRVGVIAQTERTTEIPEHSHLDSDDWDDRARGLGGIPSIPITTDGEENILCKDLLQDRWYEEDVLIHEFAHAIHLISLNHINASFQQALNNIYEKAKEEDLWLSTYAITNIKEYFAEGTQGFFNVQTCRSFVDNIHNNICTRDALKSYDLRLYDLIVEVFPCMNAIIDRCEDDQEELAANQILRMNCDIPDTATDSTVYVTDVTASTVNVTDVTASTVNVTDVTASTMTATQGTPTSGTDCLYARWDRIFAAFQLIFIGLMIN